MDGWMGGGVEGARGGTSPSTSCLRAQHAVESPEEQGSRLEDAEYEKTTRHETKKIALC